MNIQESLRSLAQLAALVADTLTKEIERASDIVASAIRDGGKILVCGNGGSAADAQHFAAELVGHLQHERSPYPAISLSSDPSVVTAISNDYGFDQLFARQIRGLGRPGDVLLAISTSGRSRNVLEGIRVARSQGMPSILLLGARDKTKTFDADAVISIPSSHTQRIQELHTAVLHCICETVEQML